MIVLQVLASSEQIFLSPVSLLLQATFKAYLAKFLAILLFMEQWLPFPACKMSFEHLTFLFYHRLYVKNVMSPSPSQVNLNDITKIKDFSFLKRVSCRAAGDFIKCFHWLTRKLNLMCETEMDFFCCNSFYLVLP